MKIDTVIYWVRSDGPDGKDRHVVCLLWLQWRGEATKPHPCQLLNPVNRDNLCDQPLAVVSLREKQCATCSECIGR